MKDEEYVFRSDSRDKAITARSARKARTHCGKGGRVRFPSDNLSKKELQKTNGEVKSYRLNDPMSWIEFKSMPDDLKVVYIQALRKKYKVPDGRIADMMGVSRMTFSNNMKSLGIAYGEKGGKNAIWDKEGFLSWVNGVDVPTTVPEEEPAEEPIQEPVIISEEPEAYVEDDLPFEEPDPIQQFDTVVLKVTIDELRKSNEELKAVHEKDQAEIAWLRNECDGHRMNVRILEAQMDVVRLIFGGKNNG